MADLKNYYPKSVLIIGYNTLAQAKAKGLISDDIASINVWYNPGGKFDRSVVFIPFGKSSIDCFLTDRIRYIEWNFSKKSYSVFQIISAVFHVLWAVVFAANIIKKESVQVVRANGPHIPALIGLMLKQLVDRPTIVFIEAFWEKLLPSQSYMTKWLRAILPYWYKHGVYNNFDIYCGTPSVDPEYFINKGMKRERISDWFHELDLVALINNANQCVLPQYIAKMHNPRLVAVGRLHHEKHPFDLVRVLAGVKKYFPEAQLILVGDGEERETLLELANQLGVHESLWITGTVEQAMGLAIVCSCDIYVAPMQGNALVEAMSVAKPIVAYDHAWHRNLISNLETGILTPYRDIDKMTEAVVQLLKNPIEAKKLGLNAKADGIARFGTSAVTERLLRPFADAWAIKRRGKLRWQK